MVRVLRIDVCGGLLDGSWEQWSDAEIIEHLLADVDLDAAPGEAIPDDAIPDDAIPDDATPDDATPDDATPDGAVAADHEEADRHESNADPADDLEDDGVADRGIDDSDGIDVETEPHEDGDGNEDDGNEGGEGYGRPPDPLPPGPRPGPAGASPPRRRGRSRARPHIEVRATLTTLLGRDEHPGEVAVSGMGTQSAAARQVRALVRRLCRATWRIVLTGPDGHLLVAGTTRARPRAPDPPAAPPSGRRRDGASGYAARAVVEIRLAAADIDDFDARPDGPWEPVIAAARLLARRPIADDRWESDPRDGDSGDEDDRDPRRRPDVALENLIRTRDRTCVFPGCRAPAHACEIDHSHEWARRGRTSWGNLGAMCASDHRMKGAGGWTLRQVRPGTFTWTAPGSGIAYERVRRPLERPYPPPAPDPRRFVAVPEPDDTVDGTPDGQPCPILDVRRPPPPGRPTLAEERAAELRARLEDWRRKYGIGRPADTCDETPDPPF